MRALLVCACVSLGVVPGFAQDCTPVPHRYLLWGQPGERIVWGETVPAGEVWELQFGGLATNDSREFDYMAQVWVPPGWFAPHGNPRRSGSTPVLAFEHGSLLSAGEAIGGRVNAPSDYAGMAVVYKVFRYPEACLSRRLFAPVVTGGSSGSVMFPTFSLTLQGTATPQP